MGARIACGQVTASSADVSRLVSNFHFRSCTITVAVDADQFQRQPMIGTAGIREKGRAPTQYGHGRVHGPIVVPIAEGKATSGDGGELPEILLHIFSALDAEHRWRL